MSYVGEYLKNKRKSVGLSQRALGQLLTPPVTTQFISNIERGVTPLPTDHIPTLSKLLSITEQEMMNLLEKEYLQKLSHKLGRSDLAQSSNEPHTLNGAPVVIVSQCHHEFFSKLYAAFQSAEPKDQQLFIGVCESVLKVGSEHKAK
jgi:transcriptional regulator with XRE-family HTH domain